MTLVNNTTTKNKCPTKFKSNFSVGSLLISIMTVIVMLTILIDSVTYAKSIIKGLTLFFTNVLPGLLPFMFFVKLLTNQKTIFYLTKPFTKISYKVFGVNNFSFYAFIMSIISGYPIGAKITSDLYLNGQISEQDLTKTAIFSSTPGLIFVIGSVGGLMLNNALLGLYIYLINIASIIISSILINLIFHKKKKDNKQSLYFSFLNNNSKQSLGALTQDTTISLLSVGFYIALFTLIIDLFSNLGIINFIPSLLDFNESNTIIFKQAMSGIIEMTNGVKQLANTLSPISFALICSIISFSGLSIIIQSLSFLSVTPLKPHKFILGKILQAIICFLLALLLSTIIL